MFWDLQVRMKDQAADSHPHEVQNAVGEAGRNRQSQDRVRHDQGKDGPVTAKHLAEEQSPNMSTDGQYWAGNMSQGKKRCRGKNRLATAQHGLDPDVDKRLQDELLYNCPDGVLPCRMPGN